MIIPRWSVIQNVYKYMGMFQFKWTKGRAPKLKNI